MSKLATPLQTGEEAYLRDGRKCKVVYRYLNAQAKDRAAIAVTRKDGYEHVYFVDARTGEAATSGDINQLDVVSHDPPFDWDKLWRRLPCWHNWVAMDAGGSWYSFGSEPGYYSATWHIYGDTEGGDYLLIPKAYAPPKDTISMDSLHSRPASS